MHAAVVESFGRPPSYRAFEEPVARDGETIVEMRAAALSSLVRAQASRARGDEEAPAAIRDWAVKLEAKPKCVVASTRTDFPWSNSHHIAGDLRTGVQKLKDATPAGVLLGSGTLATELDRLDLIDEYKFLVHPRIAGHGPTLYQSGLPSTRRLELVSAMPLRSGAVAMHYRRARV